MTPTLKDAYRLLHQGTIALAQVEQSGMRIDVPYLEKSIKETEAKIEELRKLLTSDKVFFRWKRRFGDRTKLGSREQLATVLFDVMGLPSPGFTEGSKDSVKKRLRSDEAVLAKVDLPFVREYVRYQKLLKVKGTYLEGILKEVVGEYLHPVFNLHLAATYRSTADSPNSQNIPARNEELAKLVRTAFIPRKGRRLGETDFKGIEVCVSACYNRDPNLIKYITDPSTDMHRDTAMQLFFLEKDQVDKKTTRDWAKNRFVFPQFYGSVYFQCAPHLWEAVSDGKVKLPGGEVSLLRHLKKHGIRELGECDPKGTPRKGTFEAHVKSVEDDFWKRRFRVYAEWKDRWYAGYCRDGYFDTLTGFKIQWGKGGPLSRNDCINYGTQGSAFHCLLWSLIQVQKWLVKNKMRTKIIGQIHDSIIADVHPAEEQDYFSKVTEVISRDLLKHWDWIVVPMTVEVEASPTDGNWHQKAGWACKEGVWGPAK
jgi:DNA polymerase-1